jgi:hypothetical protein
MQGQGEVKVRKVTILGKVVHSARGPYLSTEALKEHTSRFGERYRSDRGVGGVLVEDDKLEIDFIVVDQTLTLPSSPVTIV